MKTDCLLPWFHDSPLPTRLFILFIRCTFETGTENSRVPWYRGSNPLFLWIFDNVQCYSRILKENRCHLLVCSLVYVANPSRSFARLSQTSQWRVETMRSTIISLFSPMVSQSHAPLENTEWLHFSLLFCIMNFIYCCMFSLLVVTKELVLQYRKELLHLEVKFTGSNIITWKI